MPHLYAVHIFRGLRILCMLYVHMRKYYCNQLNIYYIYTYIYIYVCCSIGGLLVFQCVQVDVSYSLKSWYSAAFCSLKRRTFPPSRCFTSPGDVDCIAMSSLTDLVQDFVSAGELSKSKVTAIGTRNTAGDVTDLGRLHSTAEENPEADPCGVSIYSVEEEWKRVMAPAIEEHGDQVTQCGTEVEQVVTNLKEKIDQCIETGKTEDTDEKEERREGSHCAQNPSNSFQLFKLLSPNFGGTDSAHVSPMLVLNTFQHRA